MNFEHAFEYPSTRLLFPRDQAVDSASNSTSVASSVEPYRVDNYHRDGEYIGEEEQQESEEGYEDYISDQEEEQTDAPISEGVEGPEISRGKDRNGGSDDHEQELGRYDKGYDDLEDEYFPPPVPDYQSDVGSILRDLLARSRQDHIPNPRART
jgi:hypothetical protein